MIVFIGINVNRIKYLCKKKIIEWVGGDDICVLFCYDIDFFIWGGLEKDIGVIFWWKKLLDGMDDVWNFVLWFWNYKLK